ncbi:Lrp/AsnC family transcriptional regulator [Chloroflexota bacterium]
MDELDYRIIEELQSDSRQSDVRLAKILGTNVVTVRKRIHRLVSDGSVILTALPNLIQLGYPVRAFITLGIVMQKGPTITEQLCQYPCLRLVVKCIGFADISLRGNFKSTGDLAEFVVNDLGSIKGISNITTMILLKDVKTTYRRVGAVPKDKAVLPEGQTIEISETERKIILELQRNARTPLKKLAYDVGVSDVTVYKHIKKLVSSGTIDLTAIASFKKLGYAFRSLIGIEAETSRIFSIAEDIAQHAGVFGVNVCSGSIQILVAFSMRYYDEFFNIVEEIRNIEGVIKVETLTYSSVLKETFTWI